MPQPDPTATTALSAILFPLDEVSRQKRIDQIRRTINSVEGAAIWDEVREAAFRELDAAPYQVDSLFPGRDPYSAQLKGMDYTLCRSIGHRILRHALLFLMDGDPKWIYAALAQTDLLFDDQEYPAWNHRATMEDPDTEVHLRTGMLANSVGMMLNWLRPHLDPDACDRLVQGLEKRAIQPFLAAIEEDPWWIQVNNNWLTCIVGGLGIAGMALDGLHQDARRLVSFADPLMERHLEDFGPEGEFNEGLGYIGAVGLVVDYFSARLGWTDGGENRLARPPFPEIGRFSMHMTVPPGRLFAYGDGKAGAPLKANWMLNLASANQDPILQDYALRFRSSQADPLQLLALDPTLKGQSPEGHLPLGKAFYHHGACISSRTSWDWDGAASVVGSKARREDNHEHNDPGQVVIDGAGQPLIVDWGTPPTAYPAGFFTHDRFRYFETQAFGHNILVFGGRDLKSCYVLHPDYTEGPLHGKRALKAQGRIVSAEFDQEWGGLWTIDTTEAWDGVRFCRRTVLHVFSGFVVVFDEAGLEEEESISLRWNTAETPKPTGDHGFILEPGPVSLAASILNLDTGAMQTGVGNHQYHHPWNQDQFGGTLPERQCPYFEARTEGRRCQLLSLFAVQPGGRAEPWQSDGESTIGTIGSERLVVTPGPEGIKIHAATHGRDWLLPAIS